MRMTTWMIVSALVAFGGCATITKSQALPFHSRFELIAVGSVDHFRSGLEILEAAVLEMPADDPVTLSHCPSPLLGCDGGGRELRRLG